MEPCPNTRVSWFVSQVALVDVVSVLLGQPSAGAIHETVYRWWPAFPVAGPTIWNMLPDNMTFTPSLSTFRQHLKTFLFQASFSDIIVNFC